MNELLADRTSLIDASGIRKVFALAATLKDPVNFSIGQPDFDVPDEVKKSAISAIEKGFNSYSQTTGDKELLDKIKASLAEDYGWNDPAVMVTSGVSGSLLLAFMATINPGDEVIIPDPYFVIYKHVINLLGGKCVFVDSYPDFDLPVGKIAEAITDRTKMIIVNSPTNPTGAVYDQQKLKELAGLAEKKNVLVMSDEIYDKFSYDRQCPSMADCCQNLLLLKGFSKTYAMTGWRMAYAACPAKMKGVIEQMAKIQQYTFVCAPTPFQKAAITAIDCDVSRHVKSYAAKRDMLFEGIRDRYEVLKPGGAFYMFAKAPGWAKNATEFVTKAIENNLLVIPGNVFSEKDTHFRMSYATSEDKIAQGIEILNKLARG